MMSFVPPSELPFAVVEAKFQEGEACLAPTSTKWLRDITSSIDSKGQLLLKCTLFWPANDDEAHEMILKHAEPDLKDSSKWMKAIADVTIFRFCSTLAEAKSAMEDAAYLSSVGTQLELGKRMSRPNSKYANSDSEDDIVTQPAKKMKKVHAVAGKPVVKEPFKNRPGGCTVNSAKKPTFSLTIQSSKDLDNRSSEHTSKPEQAPRSSEQTPGSSKQTPQSSKQAPQSSEQTPQSSKQTPGSSKQTPQSSEKTPGSSDKIREMKPTSQQANKPFETSPEADPVHREDDYNRDDDEVDDFEGDIGSGYNKSSCAVKTPAAKIPFSVTPSVPRQLWSSPNKNSRASFSPVKQKNLSYARSKEHSGGVTQAAFERATCEMNRKLDDIITRVNAIYLVSCPGAAAMDKENDSSGLPTMPLDSMEELESFDEFIKTEEHAISASIVLSGGGGNTLKEITYNVLKKLVTDTLAAVLNMDGRNRRGGTAERKTGFKYLGAYEVVHSAIKRRAKKLLKRTKQDLYDGDLCNTYIANWLKDGPKRFKTEEKKKGHASDETDHRLEQETEASDS